MSWGISQSLLRVRAGKTGSNPEKEVEKEREDVGEGGERGKGEERKCKRRG